MNFRSLFQVFITITLFVSIPILSDSNSTGTFQHSIGDMTIASLFETHKEFQLNYEDYQPRDLPLLQPIPDLEIQILFGTWCHDSAREVPRLLKLLKEMGVLDHQIHLVGLNLSKSEPLNREVKFDVKKTPTFVFLRGKQEIGRIIEKPGLSLESDLQIILSRY